MVRNSAYFQAFIFELYNLLHQLVNGAYKGRILGQWAAIHRVCENESLFLLTGTRRCETFRIIINTGQTLEFVERRSLNGRNHNRDIHHTKNGHNSSQRAVV
ncbi:hypothetical protein Y032_0371g135 [Ancylostoma ceylanicum]|uniref:Uncharacterized protein n=1 Tax=Ancylostoma ceylanicum TaxID=53326 RepID=A0A016RUZ4_9BILA|nr:hypothetical protein Y032_0371g135 [Ancylostoma ceylanicum]